MEKDYVFSGKVKPKGIFDFPELYRFCYTWLVDKDYWVVEDSYSEKIAPNGKEVEIEWTAKKKVTDYFAFNLKLMWRIVAMTDVEVEKEGKKMKMNKGIQDMKVSAILVKDYENNWEKNAFLKFLRGVYDRYIIRSRIEQFEDKIHAEADEFLAQVKAFLALEGKR